MVLLLFIDDDEANDYCVLFFIVIIIDYSIFYWRMFKLLVKWRLTGKLLLLVILTDIIDR